MEESYKGKTYLVVIWNGQPQALKNVDRTQSEGTSTRELLAWLSMALQYVNAHVCWIFLGEALSELISFVQESEAKYAVLYVSDISRAKANPVSFLQGTAKVSSRMYNREWVNQFHKLW